MKIIKCLITLILLFFIASFSTYNTYSITFYPVKVTDQTLFPVKKKIHAQNSSDLCNKILRELLVMQHSPAYMNLLPYDLSVSVKNTNASVDLPHSLNLPDKEKELLFIYSIVNSLTSSGDIVTIDFTLNNKKPSNYFRSVDINESFIPDYDICS